jgi:hypothetical protein
MRVGAGSGAAGSIYFPVVLSNVSSDPCWLSGYPTVWFVTASGDRTGTAPPDGPPVGPVMLGPGGAAHVVLQVTDAGPDLCPHASLAVATTLVLLLPGEWEPFETSWRPDRGPRAVCRAGPSSVSPIVPGVEGSAWPSDTSEPQ